MEFKETGITRRIDDLGRISIPKDIRRQCRIHEGDPMEVCCSDGCVIFKPYLHHCMQQKHYVKTMYDIFQQSCKQQGITAELTIFDSEGQIMQNDKKNATQQSTIVDPTLVEQFIKFGGDCQRTEQNGQIIIWCKFPGHNYISSHDFNLYTMVNVTAEQNVAIKAILQTISVSYKIFLKNLNGNTD